MPTIQRTKGDPLRRPRDPKHPDPVGITIAKDRLEYTLEHHIEDTLELAYDLLGKYWSWLPELIEDDEGCLRCPHCHAVCDDGDTIKTWDTGYYSISEIDTENRQVTYGDHESDYDNDFLGFRCGGCGKLSKIPSNWNVESN